MRSVRPLFLAVVAILSLLALAGGRVDRAEAVSPDLFFSEYVEGTSNNKALEIFNGTGAPVNLAEQLYSVQMFFNGSSSAGLTINLSGTIPAGGTHVLAHTDALIGDVTAQRQGGGWFNGDDAVVLRKGLTVVDVIGQIGSDPGAEWGSALTSTMDNTLRRKSSILAGDSSGSDAFDPSVEWDGFAVNTFDGLGLHTTGGDAPVSVICGGALGTLEGVAASRTITATDADGTVTNLSVSVSPATDAITSTVTPATTVGGTATAVVDAASSLPAGTYTVTATAANDDAPTAQTGLCSFTLTVQEIKPIGEIQGAVSDTDNGLLHRSPFAPATGNGTSAGFFYVQGVITQKSFARSSAGAAQRGFFIQNTEATADGNPNTSDALFVFMGGFTTLIGGYEPVVGDEVVISGRVSEFFNLTQLSSARLERLVSSGNSVAPFAAVPPNDLAAANRFWERNENELGELAANSIVLDGRDVFDGTFDTEVWTAPPGTDIAMRSDPYTRRAFRDFHPFDNLPGLFNDGNGYRVLLGGNGVKAAANDNLALLAPSRTFQTVANSPVGAVNFSFNKYRLEVTTQPLLVDGVDPAQNAPPAAFDRASAYSVSGDNVENLYDFRDDPTDGCDFVGNSGCPGVNPPFNYVPADDADYRNHLSELATQIRVDQHAPDFVMVQEAEDQDICTPAGGALDCGAALNNPDGKPDTVQELALEISAQGGPAYDVANDRNGADDRGIVSAIMWRKDRVELLPASPTHPVFGSSPTVEYRAPGLAYNSDVQNPKALNATLPPDVDTSTGRDGTNVFTRPPQVGLFRLWRGGIGTSVFQDVYVISNHFSSTPDARVGQRTEQSGYLAAIVNALKPTQSTFRAIVGGDFNTFPRPDDPLGPSRSSDQLGPLYDAAGLVNLFDRLVTDVPASAYSYVFVGQAQTLDMQFVSPAVAADVEQTRVAHINADWPAEHPGDGARGASDHDPTVSRVHHDVTIAGLRGLLDFYRANGEVADKAYRKLVLHLAFAEWAKSRGLTRAYESAIRSFAKQAYERRPKYLSARASSSLVAEANRLVPPKPGHDDDDDDDDD